MAATTPESSAAAAIPRGQFAAVAAAIALATLAVYAPVADFPFLSWDDGVYVAVELCDARLLELAVRAVVAREHHRP